jgi:transposase
MANRRKFTPEFKTQVVLEMLTEHKSAAQLSREYGIKDSVISRWKQEFIDRSPTLFEDGSAENDERSQRIAELERLVGRLTLELDAAKKVSRYLNSR